LVATKVGIDGEVSTRSFQKSDIALIPSGSVQKEGWLHKSGAVSSSWSRRFMVLKGNLMFYFHAPQNDRPIGAIPMEGCVVITPDDNARSFTTKAFKSNDGFEFEIQHHDGRGNVRFQAATEEERNEWVSALRDSVYTEGPLESDIRQEFSTSYTDDSQIFFTGIYVADTDTDKDVDFGVVRVGKNMMSGDFEYPGYDDPDPNFSIDLLADDSKELKVDPFRNVFNFEEQRRGRVEEKEEESGGGGGDGVGERGGQKLHSSIFNQPNIPTKTGANDDDDTESFHIVPLVKSPSPLALASSPNRALLFSEIATPSDVLIGEENEEKLQQRATSIAMYMDKGKRRIEAVRDNPIRTAQFIDKERLLEAKNPLTLSEMLRTMIFSSTEQLVEDGVNNYRIPNVRGLWSNTVLTKLFESYSSVKKSLRGMNFQDLVHFCDDLKIIETHVPVLENGQPDPIMVAKLHPLELLSKLPSDIGYHSDVVKAAAGDDIEALNDILNDDTMLNFTQFFFLILQIAAVVYEDIHVTDPTLATHKLIQEALIPLYIWNTGYHILGCTNKLLLDRKVALILFTYGPNLWQVFTTYGQYMCSIRSKQEKIPYPEGAKCSERAQHGVPDKSPFNRSDVYAADPEFSKLDAAMQHRIIGQSTTTDRIVGNSVGSIPANKLNSEGIVLNETSALKLFSDFGIVPNLLSKREFKSLFSKVNRIKRVQPVAVSSSAASAKGVISPMRAESTQMSTTSPLVVASPTSGSPTKGKKSPKISTEEARVVGDSGISFSEFLELLGEVACAALTGPDYNIMFPNAYHKIVGLLTVLGFADLQKLEDVNLMNSENIVTDTEKTFLPSSPTKSPSPQKAVRQK